MDFPTLFKMLFELVGGLGIFLLGMKNMSDGMQAVAGNSLRRLIGAITNHRIFATLVGVIVTCIVQSSSITTVMVIGFVNSGVMELSQAVGVIMGANVGTTITGWILVLQVGKYGLPMLGFAAFVYLFSRGDGFRFTESQRADLSALNRQVAEYLAAVHEAFSTSNRNVLNSTDANNKRIRDSIKALRRKHLEELSDGSTPPVVSVAYMAALNAYVRVRDHTHNIAETIAHDK